MKKPYQLGPDNKKQLGKMIWDSIAKRSDPIQYPRSRPNSAYYIEGVPKITLLEFLEVVLSGLKWSKRS